jgi:hypothetical protein
MRKLNIRENGRASRSKSATKSVTVVILSEAKDLNFKAYAISFSLSTQPYYWSYSLLLKTDH